MKQVVVTVPGKIMLSGEYTVLDGGESLAFTVDKFLTVEARQADGIVLHSDLWDEPITLDGNNLPLQAAEPLVDAVLAGLRLYPLPGLELHVRSALDVRHGLGSSSALRLGVLLAIGALRDPSLARQGASGAARAHWQLAEEALIRQRLQQSLASGYDIATQLIGGLVSMRADGPWPGNVQQLPLGSDLFDLVHVFVGGQGAPTGPVASETRAWLASSRVGPDLQAVTSELAGQWRRALSAPDDKLQLTALCDLVGRHRRFFRQGPHYPLRVATILETLPGLDRSWSYKTTGAGGEDALLLIGPRAHILPAEESLRKLGWQRFDGRFTAEGAQVSVETQA